MLGLSLGQSNSNIFSLVITLEFVFSESKRNFDLLCQPSNQYKRMNIVLIHLDFLIAFFKFFESGFALNELLLILGNSYSWGLGHSAFENAAMKCIAWSIST
jgi:hypothetical protein